jgi:hypothetical protein
LIVNPKALALNDVQTVLGAIVQDTDAAKICGQLTLFFSEETDNQWFTIELVADSR